MIVIKVVLAYNVESIAFCCVVTGFPRFDQRKAAKMTLGTHFFFDGVISLHMKMQTIK